MAHIVYGIDYGQRFKKIFWTGLNQSGQFRIKKDLLLFYYFIIFIIPMMSSVSPVRLTVWSIAYQSVPVWSSLFRLCPVLFCSKLFRNEFGSVRFWSFFELISGFVYRVSVRKYPVISNIHALGNYFQVHDQWDQRWSDFWLGVTLVKPCH